MNSQESHHQPQPQIHSLPHHHHHHHQHQQPLHGHGIMTQQQHNSYTLPDNLNKSVMMQQQQVQQQNPGFGFDYSDGSGSSARATTGFSIEAARKKRGRPRKYSPDGNIALGLSPTPLTPITSSSSAHNTDTPVTPCSDNNNSSKKLRGRPPTPGKIQLDALGAGGVGFTPHVIVVNVGEDIASKLMAFSEQGPRTVCILSAHGAICNVTLRQPAMGGGSVAYEGRFEIISLSGSFLHSTRTSSLSVSLAGSDGRVLGGGVAGTLMAATPVQVIVGSFIAEGKKPKSKTPSLTPPPSNMLNFGGPALGGASPPSQDASSDSGDENGGSPLSHEQRPYGNAGQPLHGMPMYANMGWPNNNVKMVP
ncbi:AT-hook motif nuclear-localized protein 8-like [Lycium ferocissimum]|uniref:AT-hook motif nuclear-localized protein 8-like n=1 Tax=Lycium ferocissimum TaxID=112874 RepID=UPI002815EFBB|nr:AT-hook motif nuclear-localized protein 8-like [Lycium ferocissimum]